MGFAGDNIRRRAWWWTVDVVEYHKDRRDADTISFAVEALSRV